MLTGACSLRSQVADASVALLAIVCLSALDRLGASDPKHGTRLRLENLAFLDDWLMLNAKSAGHQSSPFSPLSSQGPKIGGVMSALQQHVGAAREAALQLYLKQQLDNAKLLSLDMFAQVNDPRCLSNTSLHKKRCRTDPPAAQ